MKKNKKEENKQSIQVQKEKKTFKFFNIIKKKWLITRTKTILLIAILIAIFILINLGVKKWNPTAIDCTTSKDYSLTDESKERIKNIDKDVNIYFVGFTNTDKSYTLAEQYNKVNSKIKIQIIDPTKNVEVANKYKLTSESKSVIVESGEISRTIDSYDMVTYDSDYNEVDVSEQKITSAILNVTSGVIPKVYYLTGYTSYSFKNGLTLFAKYLDDEVLKYEELNLLSKSSVPEDCNTLIIVTPEKDFDKGVADSIITYIKNGGNILWLQGAYPKKIELTNVNRVLAEYGIDPFDVGIVYETNKNKTIMGYSACFIPEIQDTAITSDVYKGLGSIFLYATKININEEKLSNLNVEETDLITTGETTYFTEDLTGNTSSDKDKKGGFVLGTEMKKKISKKDDEEVTSKLIIYGNEAFITDYTLTDNSNNQYNMIYLYNNADLGLNSIAYLTDKDEDITIRKNYSDSITEFTPTDGQKSIIMKIIFIVPIAIIILGIIVWIKRKNRQ